MLYDDDQDGHEDDQEVGRVDDQKEEKSPIGVTDCKALHHSGHDHMTMMIIIFLHLQMQINV